MKHKSKAHLSKQLATKRDVQRARDEILSAIVHATPSGGTSWEWHGERSAPFTITPDRIERAVNG